MMRNALLSIITIATALGAASQVPVDSVQAVDTRYSTCDPVVIRISRTNFSVGVVANAGNSELSPYYIGSNYGGVLTQQYSVLAHASLEHNIDMQKRFSWGAGIEAWGGYASSAGYQRYVGNGQFEVQQQHPARIWLQEAYVAAKYRSIFAVAGQARKSSPIVEEWLSSGDLVWSNNARPPVGVRAGFIDFQDIPFTKGWLQIKGEFGYFREFDDKWLENHYNYYNHFITTDTWLHYKAFQLRTNPNKPLIFTIGAQSACQFGGTADYYENGQVIRTVKMDADAKAFWRTFIAGSGGNSAGDSFVEGNHLGTWDIALEHGIKDTDKTLRLYTQWLWEDGSGIGKMNGFDGLWGLEYRNTSGLPLITGAVIEYIDFTNQSGPIHWTPNDRPGTPIISHSSGADDYYNNYIYNGYQSRGMSIGSPFVKSPLYNQDGYMRYRDNVMRGFHAAIEGFFSHEWFYRLQGSYRKAWGTPIIPRAGSVDDFSMALRVYYTPDWLTRWNKVERLTINATVAVDHGKLYGNNWGVQLGIYYNCNLFFKRR
ncbi:MAG: hypothetical protein J5503_07555 [Muribaculaceae bacterium]|nr:hypothetical protein [Muribaculaceae bacterium]